MNPPPEPNPVTQRGAGWPRVRRLPTLLKVAVISAVLASALTACGPGTGGTGVGPIASTSLFSGSYVSQIGGAGMVTPATGNPGVVVTPGPGASFAVVFEPQQVSLSGACLSFTSNGVRVESSGDLRIDGLFRLTTPGVALEIAPTLPGTLVARIEGTGLRVTLLSANGAILANFGTSARLADGVVPAPTEACVAAPG